MKPYLKNMLLFFFLPALFALSVFLVFDKSLDSRISSYIFDESYNAPIDEIVSSTVLKQEFICASDSINAVELLIGTFGRDLSGGEWTLELLDDETGYALTRVTVDISRFIDNKYAKITLPKVSGIKGKRLSLIIESNAAKGKSATIYKNTKNEKLSGLGKLLVNGKEADGTLNVHFRRDISFFEFLDRVTQFKPGFIKGGLFYLAVFLSLYGFAFMIIHFLLALLSELNVSETLGEVSGGSGGVSSIKPKHKVILAVLTAVIALCIIDIILIYSIGGVKFKLSVFSFSSTTYSRPVIFLLISLFAAYVLLKPVSKKQ